MASRNVGCFLGLRKLMKANTEQLACWRRSDSRARRVRMVGASYIVHRENGGGGSRGECESEGTSPFSIPPPFLFFIVNSFSRALLSERLEKATQQH